MTETLAFQPPEEKINVEEFSRSLNGFDDVAISGAFGKRFAHMEDFETGRALLFVWLRREHGMKDREARASAMAATVGDLEGMFSFTSSSEGILTESEQAERDREYGEFIIGAGVSFTWEQYAALTAGQRSAIIEAANSRGGR